MPIFQRLRLYALYQKRGFTSFKQLADLSRNKKALSEDSSLYFQARAMVFPFMFISAGARQQFFFDKASGGYTPKMDYLFELQFGYEWLKPEA